MSKLAAATLVSGYATGQLAILDAALSLWGGLDLNTGEICDNTHPQRGTRLTGKILAMPAARGSSSSSSALVESLRRGVGPAGIILGKIDPILIIGGLVAADLYGLHVPIVLIEPIRMERLRNGSVVRINALSQGAIIEEEILPGAVTQGRQ